MPENIYDKSQPPKRTEEMRTQGQVWVWLSYPDQPRWEIRGTGVRLASD